MCENNEDSRSSARSGCINESPSRVLPQLHLSRRLQQWHDLSMQIRRSIGFALILLLASIAAAAYYLVIPAQGSNAESPIADTADWAPVFSTDFESDTVGQKPLGFEADGIDDFVVDDRAASGTQSFRSEITKGAVGSTNDRWGLPIAGHAGPAGMTSGDEVWMQLKTFWPVGANYTARPWMKFLRMYTVNSQLGKPPPEGEKNNTNGWLDIYIRPPSATTVSFHTVQEEVPDYFDDGPHDKPTPYGGNWLLGDGGDKIVPGEWETYEVYYYLDERSKNEGGNAVVRLWKNCELIGEVTAMRTLRYDADYLSGRVLIFNYWNGGAPSNQHVYIDDVEISTSDDPPTNNDRNGNAFIGGCLD